MNDDEYRPMEIEDWEEEFVLGLFSWAVIPLYAAFVIVVGIGLGVRQFMDFTRRKMEAVRDE